MRFHHRLLSSAAAGLVVAAAAAATALGQDPNRSTSQAILIGRVLDTAGAVLADAEVVVTHARDTTLVRRATSNARGDVTLSGLPAGGPYTLLARKIGYGAARGTDVHLQGGDTLRVDFELPPTGVTLPTITVRSRRGSASMITAEEFDPKDHPDALNVIAWKRPYMLGDPDRCRLPPTPAGPVPNSRGSGRRPWLNASRFFDVFNPPYSPYVQRVYVNGVRVDRPGESPLIALHEIPSAQIAEIRYVDCTSTLDVWPYSIYVVLKPSQAVQDSMQRQRPSDPREIRQRRQAWDSILRSLKWGDSTRR